MRRTRSNVLYNAQDLKYEKTILDESGPTTCPACTHARPPRPKDLGNSLALRLMPPWFRVSGGMGMPNPPLVREGIPPTAALRLPLLLLLVSTYGACGVGVGRGMGILLLPSAIAEMDGAAAASTSPSPNSALAVPPAGSIQAVLVPSPWSAIGLTFQCKTLSCLRCKCALCLPSCSRWLQVNRHEVPTAQHAARSTQHAARLPSRGQVNPVPVRDQMRRARPKFCCPKSRLTTNWVLGVNFAAAGHDTRFNGVRCAANLVLPTDLQSNPGQGCQLARHKQQGSAHGERLPARFGGYPPSVPIQCPPRTKRHTSWEVCCRRTPALKSKASRRAQIRMRRIAERAVGQGKRMHDARGIVSLPVGLASLLPLPNARNATTSLASRSVLLVVGFLAVSRKSTSRAGRPKS